MPVFHAAGSNTSVTNKAIGQLREALQTLSERQVTMDDFEQFERELHGLFVDAERDVLAAELAQLDIDLPCVCIEGVKHRRVLRSPATYTSAVGPIKVMRTLYCTALTTTRRLCRWNFGRRYRGQWNGLLLP